MGLAMYLLITLVMSSFCVSVTLTPLCRKLAIRWNLVDRPDLTRKFHASPIPRIGGIPIFIAYLAAFGVLLLSPFKPSKLLLDHFEIVRALFPAALIIFTTGLLDDLIGLKPLQKLVGQFAAAGVAVWSGIQIKVIVWHQFPAWLAIPLTVLWLVGCTNAFNLIDGMDGLAAGVGLLATVVTLVAALLGHNIGMAIAIVPLVGAILGFLRFNFNPASIFMGDSGSLFIGFLLGCYSVLWSQKSATILGMTAPLIALSIPILDTALAVVRRYLRYQPILGADRGHIHHKLLARGLTHRTVVFFIYLVSGLCGVLSLLQSFAHEHFGGLIVLLLCVGIAIGVHHLGYAELEVARKLIIAGNFRRQLNAELHLSTFREKLSVAETPDQCWDVLRHFYIQFGFNEIRFKFGDRVYTEAKPSDPSPNTWTIRIKLSGNDYLNLSREFGAAGSPITASFTDAAGEILCSKAAPELFKRPSGSITSASLQVDAPAA